MLYVRDIENLKELGKKCRSADFPPIELVQMILRADPMFAPIVQSIFVKKDSFLDQYECQLLCWARTFVFRIRRVDGYDAEPYILEGYYSLGGVTSRMTRLYN